MLLLTYLLTYLLTNYVQDPAREEIYDAVKAEYELDARLEALNQQLDYANPNPNANANANPNPSQALNQQLDYAEGAMHSIKEDRQHRHSLFVEYTIVLLILFEVGIALTLTLP